MEYGLQVLVIKTDTYSS